MNALDTLNAVQPEIPIACSLTPGELVERGRENATLFDEREETRELPDGFALRFPGNPDLASRLLRLMLAERACCPFFAFELLFEPGEGPIWLHIRGPEGVREMVRSMLT